MGWENFETAWSIWTNSDFNYWQRFGAGAYMGAWGGAHVGLLVGAAGMACVAAGPGCVQVVEGALGIGTVLGADGDPTNELYSVYRVVQNGNNIYYGMTKNPAQRFAYWNNVNGWKPEPVLENLSKFDARAVEQVLIESTGLANLANKINSIAVSNPIYLDAIQRGKYLLGLP